MVEIIHSISIHFPRLLWQPGLCHNYHKFIYSSGVFWEVKQGGRYFDKTTRESREEFCCAEGVLGVVSVLWFRVVWVFFFILTLIYKITCLGSYSFLQFLHVLPLWLFWQWCSRKEWVLKTLLRDDTMGHVRFLCRWLLGSWQRGSSVDSASRRAGTLLSRVVCAV